MKLDIDFSQHPAFAEHVQRRSGDGFDFRPLFAEVDGIAGEIYRHGGPHATLAERWAAYDKRVQPLRKKFEQALAEDREIDPMLTPHLGKHFRTAVKELAIEREFMLVRRRPDADLPSSAHAAAEEMDAIGYKKWHLPARWFNPLLDFLQEDLQALRAQAAEGATDLLLREPGPLPQALLKDFCEREGVLDAISALYGRKFSKVGFSLHVSHPGDKWYHTFDDIGLPVSRTAQMHYDRTYDVPKAMVYMNDVAEEQGPFSLIPKSHHWEDLGISLAFRKQVTLALADYLKDVKAAPLGANASRFQRAEARKAFASMPTSIRATAHPGDLILDGTPLSDSLLKEEAKLTGEAGCLAVFTGGHVIHRGGICRAGQRWALQTCFWPDDPVKMPKKEELQSAGLVESKPQKKSFFGGLFGRPQQASSDVKKKSLTSA